VGYIVKLQNVDTNTINKCALSLP